MLDHVALEVADLDRAARFYDAIMRALGGRRIVSSPDGIGYGRDRPELWVCPRARRRGRPAATWPSRRSAGGPSTPPTRPAWPPAGATAGRPPRARGPARHYSGYLVDPDGAYVEVVSGG